VTPAFLATGLTATGITVVGMLLALSMPAVALTGLAHAYMVVALSSACWMVIDCVDGNIARLTQSTSLVGQYVDSLGGRLHYLCLNVSIAILAARETTALDQGYWLSLALAASLIRIWNRGSRADFKLQLADKSYSFARQAGAPGWRNALVSIPELAPIALLILGPLGRTHLALGCFVLLDAGIFLYTQRRILAQLRRGGQDQRHARPEEVTSPE
jgi:phosphatidylglycerophosphate synthase